MLGELSSSRRCQSPRSAPERLLGCTMQARAHPAHPSVLWDMKLMSCGRGLEYGAAILAAVALSSPDGQPGGRSIV